MSAPAVRGDWETSPMPAAHTAFSFRMHLSKKERAALCGGFIPQEMEDRWFFFMEGNRAFIHRSWSGICIYEVTLSPGSVHSAVVNRDPAEYSETDIAEDRRTLRELLRWWAGRSEDRRDADDQNDPNGQEGRTR